LRVVNLLDYNLSNPGCKIERSGLRKLLGVTQKLLWS
jgi:hypothetical protein